MSPPTWLLTEELRSYAGTVPSGSFYGCRLCADANDLFRIISERGYKKAVVLRI
jgi:hypothetical protein